MPGKKIKILSTRPVGDSLVLQAAALNIILDEISFIETEEIIDNTTANKIKRLSEQPINAVFTSMNAAEALRRFIPKNSPWNIFCIGNTTRKLLENIFGSKNIKGTGTDAADLAGNIITNSGIEKVHFFCGDHRRDEMPEKLIENNVAIEEIVVYKTIQTTHIINDHYDGILFFSPSAVESFLMSNSIPDTTSVFAIGATTADALKPFAKQRVIIADRPGKKNLVELAINYFSTN